MTAFEWDPNNKYRIVGESQLLQLVLREIGKVARSDFNLLITGEPGVGKELVARSIHARSRRAKGPFVTVNCGGISESILQAELFGYLGGSFTDAVKTGRKGKVEAADKGTLFLDEIGTISAQAQQSLLRTIETKSVCRVGAAEEATIDFRLVAATNADLKAEVNAGRMRQDFYDRLNVVKFYLPPLRERKEDVPLLANYFASRYCQEVGVPQKSFTDVALQRLQKYNWPGNVRELENLVKRCAILIETNEITQANIELFLEDTAPSKSYDTTKAAIVKQALDAKIGLNEFEELAVREALERTGNNQSQAAKLIGYSRDQLRYSMEKIGLLSPSPKRRGIEVTPPINVAGGNGEGVEAHPTVQTQQKYEPPK